MKKLLLPIFIVNILCQVFSQPSKRELIRDILPVAEIVKSIAQATIYNNPKDTAFNASNNKQNIEIIEHFINTGKEELIDSIINICDLLFNYDEIQQFGNFCKSPEGKKFKEYLPIIILKTMQAGQNWYSVNHGILKAMFDSVFSDTITTTHKAFVYEEVEFRQDNPFKYKKNKNSKSICLSNEFGYKVYYNDKIWKEIDPTIVNSSAEKAFKMVDSEVFGLILAESNDLNLKELRYTAIYNLYNASERYEILHDALRYINGNEVLSMQFMAKVNAMDIKYHNYYFTDHSRVIQFSTFTRSESYEKNKSEMEALMNGLVIIK
jgi:hypothetical protein